MDGWASVIAALGGLLTGLAAVLPVARQVRQVDRRLHQTPTGSTMSVQDSLARIEGQVSAIRDEHAGTLRRIARDVGRLEARVEILSKHVQ